MRVLILSQWCYPEPDARILNMAEDIKKKGHQVEILTGFPNYPGGDIYPGYKLNVYQKEVINEVEIKRIWLYPSHDKSAAKRAFNYLSFAFSALLLGPFIIRKPDVIYVYHPPATAAIPAIFLKFLFRAKLVYDIQDLWPESIEATGMVRKRGLLRIINQFQNFIYSKSDAITVISKGFKERLTEKGVSASKVHVIWNWSIPIGQAKSDSPSITYGPKFNILFAGNHGRVQALETIIKGAQQFWEANERDVQFVFLGNGQSKEEIVALANANALGNVLFLDRVSPDNVGSYLLSADVLLVHLQDNSLFRITVPSKIQSYLMTGRPVLAGIQGDGADLINKSGGGVTFIPEDVNDFVRKVRYLKSMPTDKLHEMGERGKSFYYSHLERSVGVEKFLKIFDSIKPNV